MSVGVCSNNYRENFPFMATASKTKTITDFSKAPVNLQLSAEQKIKILAEMVRIRRFELEANRQYQAKKMGGFLHLYNGQESVAVGCASLMGDDDHMITAYRDHGHALAVGMTMNECMAELFGRATGCSRGKGGSMHFFAPDKNFWGGHGIVGGQTPLGLGLAYALKYKGIKGAAMCFMGDGAVNQGCFYESLNMASLFSIPVVYIIENNGYSMGTSLARSSAFKNCLAERAEGFAMAWGQCNGTDVYEVRANVQVALERAYNESKPTLLEISTYRYYGHSVADAKHNTEGGYRCKEEIERYKQHHDPINIFKTHLLEEGVITEERFEQIDEAAKSEAEASAEFADQSPWPSEASIQEDVYFEVDRQTEAGRTGKHFFND
jgi:pyruvate dehydrogenase E1 component alpha subunit